MRALCWVIAIVLLQGCWYTDGTMKQVSGVEINHTALDGLTEGQSTKAQVLAALGRPIHTTQKDGEMESLEYISLRRRESETTFLKIPLGHTSQSIEERVVLTFKDGILQKKEESSKTF